MIRNVRRHLEPLPLLGKSRLYASTSQTLQRPPYTSRQPTSQVLRERGRVVETEHGGLTTRLPRYLRRETVSPADSAHPAPKHSTIGKTSSLRTAAPDSAFRSRHYDPSNKDPKSEIRLLEPHVLSSRLKKLCDASHVDAAVSMLKNAPLDAQNTPVWNTLIWEAMKAKRFKLAYQLFIDMKRRGFSPTTRTFQTMFVGLSRIEHWSSHPKQLINARAIFDAYRRHITAVRQHEPDSTELSVNPLAAYIKLLGDAGQYQEIFDVYYTLDLDGPMAANQFIFTAMFQALAKKNGPNTGSTSSNTKNAADAKLLWTQMLKISKKSPGFEVDSFLVSSAIIALGRGRTADQDFAFHIVRDYFGLTAPGEPHSSGTMPLAPQSLAAVLALCNNSQKHALCLHFMQQVKKRPDAMGGVSILDRAHMEEVLRAYLSTGNPDSSLLSLETLEWMLRQEITGRNGPKIRPSMTTYHLVLMACWRRADWISATRTFDFMTGYHCHDFMDGAVSNAPRMDRRSAGRNLVPNAETMSSMVKTALATQDRANMRQCLRLLSHLGADQLFPKHIEKVEESHKSNKNRVFYISKLASAVADIVQRVLNHQRGTNYLTDDDVAQWSYLARRASESLKTSPSSEFIPTLEQEGIAEGRNIYTNYEHALRQ